MIYEVFELNEMLEAKLLAGHSGYDVVVPSDGFVRRQIQAGLFRKLDQTKLPNAVHQWDLIKRFTAAFDPGNAYTINYLWGTTGVGVNVDKVVDVLGEDAPIICSRWCSIPPTWRNSPPAASTSSMRRAR